MSILQHPETDMAWQNLPPWIHDSWTTSGLILPHFFLNGWRQLEAFGSLQFFRENMEIFHPTPRLAIKISQNWGTPNHWFLWMYPYYISLLKKMTVFGWFRGPHFWRNTQILTSCSCLALCEDFLSTLLPGHFEVPPAVAATLLQQSQGGNVRKPNL